MYGVKPETLTYTKTFNNPATVNRVGIRPNLFRAHELGQGYYQSH